MGGAVRKTKPTCVIPPCLAERCHSQAGQSEQRAGLPKQGAGQPKQRVQEQGPHVPRLGRGCEVEETEEKIATTNKNDWKLDVKELERRSMI